MGINDLLHKFNQVEIENTSRISSEDKRFCEGHQKAYERALAYYRQGEKDYQAAYQEYSEIMSGINPNPKYASENHVYMGFYESVDPSKFYDSLQKCHLIFVRRLVGHFNSTYQVELDVEKIQELVMPEKPGGNNLIKRKEFEAYEEKLRTLVLRYEDIVDQVIARLGGYSFAEKALAELKDKCRTAAYNKYHSKWNITLKGRTLSVDSNACYETSNGRFKVREGFYPFFKALVYDELGSQKYPAHMQDFIGKGSINQKVTFGYLEKLDYIQMFKNGRLDFKFYSAAEALAFAETFLGYMAEVAA